MSKLTEYRDMYIDIVGYDGGDETGFVFQISPDKLFMIYESDGYYETEVEALRDARAVIDVNIDPVDVDADA